MKPSINIFFSIVFHCRKPKGVIIAKELTGNNLTRRMHYLTLRELRKMESEGTLLIDCIEEEKETVLPRERIGAYDFLVESGKGLIGIEVMTRPTKGKLKEKLRYMKNADFFVFVLPSNCLGLYRRKPKKGFSRRVRPKFFPSEFNDPKIQTWLLDAKQEKFTEKGAFSKIFSVRR